MVVVLLWPVFSGNTLVAESQPDDTWEVLLLADDCETPGIGEPIRASAGTWMGNGGEMVGATVTSGNPAGAPQEESNQ